VTYKAPILPARLPDLITHTHLKQRRVLKKKTSSTHVAVCMSRTPKPCRQSSDVPHLQNVFKLLGCSLVDTFSFSMVQK